MSKYFYSWSGLLLVEEDSFFLEIFESQGEGDFVCWDRQGEADLF
jgi:hypothetical protein